MMSDIGKEPAAVKQEAAAELVNANAPLPKVELLMFALPHHQ